MRNEDDTASNSRAIISAILYPLQSFGLFFSDASTHQESCAASQQFIEDLWMLYGTFLGNVLCEKKETLPLPAKMAKNRCFTHSLWNDKGYYELMQKNYRLYSQYFLSFIENIQLSKPYKKPYIFLMKQCMQAFNPSHFPAFNPEFLQKTVQENGQNIGLGIRFFLDDLQKKQITQTDNSAFSIGHNIGITPGYVVLKTKLIELIHYNPQTDTVYPVPILIVPPCINKYYILDLSPKESLAELCVQHSFVTYIVSWKNIDSTLADTSWDEYLYDMMTVCDFILARHGLTQIHIAGYCIGGVFALCMAAIQQSRHQNILASVSVIATLIEYEEAGDANIFISKAFVEYSDRAVGAGGLVKGYALSNFFSLLRAEDLIWPYCMSNYLLGNIPEPFNILYWSNDGVNLSGPMHVFYLRSTYVNDQLKVPDTLVMCGEAINLRKITSPVYAFAAIQDHISPWKSVYSGLAFMDTSVRFVLGSSGHTRGVVQPLHAKKAYHYVHSGREDTAELWREKAEKVPGSWWADWVQWLKTQSDDTLVPARNAVFYGKPLDTAPGTYVKEKTVA